METWTSKDGRTKPIREMDDKHLANTIAYLERTAGSARIAAAQSASGYCGGEQAEYAAQQAAEELYEMTDEEFLAQEPKYLALIAERERRAAIEN